MNAHSKIDRTQALCADVQAFTRAELNALVAALDERADNILSRIAAGEYVGSNALTYTRQMWSLALDCLVELDGEEPETVNPQAELADMLDDACMSIHHAMQRHMAVLAVAA